jgi:hypothetical protein
LESDALEKALAEWARAALPPNAVIAIDGKTLRGSLQAEYPAVHLLAAYCDAISGVVGQVPVATDKTNEIAAAAILLEAVPIRGCLFTGDAMFAQRAVCQAVLDGGGDYLMTVKDNQPGLRKDIDQAFAPAFSPLGGIETEADDDKRLRSGEGAWKDGGAYFDGHRLAQRLSGLAGRRAGVPSRTPLPERKRGKR